MNNSSLVKRAALSALGVYAYIALIVTFLSNAERLIGPRPEWIAATVMLTMFVVSACVTGAIVLLKPVTLYADGNKSDAVRLFAYTVIGLALIALIVGIVLVSW